MLDDANIYRIEQTTKKEKKRKNTVQISQFFVILFVDFAILPVNLSLVVTDRDAV